MREFGIFEAKNKLSALIDWVEKGEEIVITRRGKAVARLIPDTPGYNPEAARAAMERIIQRAKDRKMGPFDWNEWKTYRDEGRR